MISERVRCRGLTQALRRAAAEGHTGPIPELSDVALRMKTGSLADLHLLPSTGFCVRACFATGCDEGRTKRVH